MDLLDDDSNGDSPGSNTPEFTVGELTGAIKKTIEGSFGRVRVRGELGRVMRAASGHLYYDLKDDRNVISCTTWKGQARGLGMQPEEGLEVIVTGKLSTFGPQSRYNLNVDTMEVAGEGALMAMLERRKKALAAEGLFAEDRKRPLPYLPEVIGVVTSLQGAVIRDILHRLRDRFPRKVLIWPVAVQGSKSAPEVTRAIEGFNAMTPGGALPRPDLLIVARGGGSIEDLWGFNEEIVARAAAASQIPLISAVGHETDTTLIDFVSDRRAPTPTAAAELAVPVRLELLAWVEDQDARLTRALSQIIGQRRQRLADLSRALPKPGALVATAQQRLDIWGERLPKALIAAAQKKRLRLADAAALLRPATLRRSAAERRDRVAQLAMRLAPGLRRAAKDRRSTLDQQIARLRLGDPSREISRQRDRLSQLQARLAKAARGQVTGWRNGLDGLERLRQSLGYEVTLQRGYAVVRDGDKVITSKPEAEAAAALEIQFADGRLKLGGKPARKPAAKPPEQGSLF